MKPDEVRNWITGYLLIITFGSGLYILIAAETFFLPIRKEDAKDILEIMTPVFFGQLAICYQGLIKKRMSVKVENTAIRAWVIKGPPVAVTGALFVTILAMIIGNELPDVNFGVSSKTFKLIVIFSMSFLNCTTVILINEYFIKQGTQQG